MAGRSTRAANSVFINCPFTSDYQELFHALVFAVMDCGFLARCSLEKSDSGETRLHKLYRIIGNCRYGIHDISLTELDPDRQLPRFNMPLELGIFLGTTRFGTPAQRKNSCLILDRARYRFQTFCSDLAGQDPKAHNNAPADAIKCVRNWLRGERSELLPSGARMCQRFERFNGDLPIVADTLSLESDELEFLDLTSVTEAWLRDNPW